MTPRILTIARVLALAATAAQAQPYQLQLQAPAPASVPYTQPVPWVPRAYPPMSLPSMRIDPTLQWPSPAPVAPYVPTPYRQQRP